MAHIDRLESRVCKQRCWLTFITIVVVAVIAFAVGVMVGRCCASKGACNQGGPNSGACKVGKVGKVGKSGGPHCGPGGPNCGPGGPACGAGGQQSFGFAIPAGACQSFDIQLDDGEVDPQALHGLLQGIAPGLHGLGLNGANVRGRVIVNNNGEIQEFDFGGGDDEGGEDVIQVEVEAGSSPAPAAP